MEYVWKIYKITSPCGRAYVGITRTTLTTRWKAHQRAAKHTRVPFYDAVLEHGADAFSIKTLAECYSEWEARKCERAMIALHDTYYKGGRGFNRSIGGNGNTGGATEETRAKIRASMAARKEEFVAHLYAGQKKYNEMGRPVSEEGRAAKLRGLKEGWKKRHSPEAIAKGAATRTGRKQGPDHHAKSISACAAARAAKTPESIRKQSETNKKMWADPEFRAMRKHRYWALLQYDKALADRVREGRAFTIRGRKRAA